MRRRRGTPRGIDAHTPVSKLAAVMAGLIQGALLTGQMDADLLREFEVRKQELTKQELLEFLAAIGVALTMSARMEPGPAGAK